MCLPVCIIYFFGLVTLVVDFFSIIYISLVFQSIGSALVDGQIVATYICALCVIIFFHSFVIVCCVFIYLFDVLWYMASPICMSRSDMISSLSLRHSDFSSNSYFDIFIHVFYPFIFLFVLHGECSHVMPLQLTSYYVVVRIHSVFPLMYWLCI